MWSALPAPLVRARACLLLTWTPSPGLRFSPALRQALFPRNVYVYNNLTRVRLDLKAPTTLINHIGPSWLGPREFVLDCLALQIEYCQHLLEKEFPPGTTGNWPEWAPSVLALYAGHLAINKMVEEADGPSSVVWGTMDVYSFLHKPMDVTTMLIHAVPHNRGHFSKHAYYKTAHEGFRETATPCAAAVPQAIDDFCLYVAVCAEQLPWSPVFGGMVFVNGKSYGSGGAGPGASGKS